MSETLAVSAYLTIKNVSEPLLSPNLSIISVTWKPKPAYSIAAIWKVNALFGVSWARVKKHTKHNDYRKSDRRCLMIVRE